MAKEDGQRTCSMLGKTPGASRIVVFDDFEDRLKWKGDGLLPMGIISKSQTHVYNGNWALKVGREVWAPNGMVWRDYYRLITGCAENVFLIQGRVYFPTVGGVRGVGIGFWRRSAGVDRRWGVRVHCATGRMEYFTDEGTWEYRLGGAWAMGRDCWHLFGMVLDVRDQDYGELVCNGESQSMADLKGFESASESGDKCSVRVWVGQSAGGTVYGWFDDVVVRAS